MHLEEYKASAIHSVLCIDTCPSCGACKESVEHVLFEYASYDSQRLHVDFFNYLRVILPPDSFETFLSGSIFFIKLHFVEEKRKICW